MNDEQRDIVDKVPDNLRESLAYFSDEEKCFQFIVKMRWSDGVSCPRCQSKEHYFVKTRKIWMCKDCKKHFTVKVGTIMEDSPLSLSKWLAAIWLISNAKNGISSYEIHRAIGVTQKTAWFLLHRIRHTMAYGEIELMTGEVEVDETFIGGLAKNMHKNKREAKIQGRGGVGKTMVLGILHRGERKTKEEKRKKIGKHSKVQATVIADRSSRTLKTAVKKHIASGSTVYTDELLSYKGLLDYTHEVINHSHEYVNGHITTNGIENFWTLFKRCLKGTYVAVDPEHLPRYVSEEVFRFNEREKSDKGRFVAMASVLTGKRLTYKALTKKSEPVISDYEIDPEDKLEFLERFSE